MGVLEDDFVNISAEEFKGKLRLRWRYNKKRHSITVGEINKSTSTLAKRIISRIKQDILLDNFDSTLQRYDPQTKNFRTKRFTQPKRSELSNQFALWLKVTGMKDPPANIISTQRMVDRWGYLDFDDVPDRLSNQGLANSTYNTRLNILKRFFKWAAKKEITKDYVCDLKSKKGGAKRKQRRPLDDEDIPRILEAFKTDRFSRSSTYPHSVYYPFIKFMLMSGVRNAEAIGLTVRKIDFKKRVITIDQTLARQGSSTNIKSRVLKGTKQENLRYLPISLEMEELLRPLCEGRTPDAYVFVNKNGNPIDDRMFQRRVFKPILKQLNIEERDLYAARHTFGTIAIEQGMTPLEAGYLMGHSNPRTILANYAHLRKIPTSLPSIVK